MLRQIYPQQIQVTASDGDKDRPQNIVYFLTGQGIDPDNPANSKFDINRTTGEIFVLKVSLMSILSATNKCAMAAVYFVQFLFEIHHTKSQWRVKLMILK